MKSTIFSNKPRYFRKLLSGSVLSLILFWSAQSSWGVALQSRLATFFSPVYYVVDAPVRAIRWIITSTQTQHILLTENAKLRAHQLLLSARLQRLLALQSENHQLKHLKAVTAHLTVPVRVVQLLGVSLTPSLNQWVISAGSKQGVTVGQAVLDAYGVIGQVVSTASNTSKVLLLTDNKGAIAVQNLRTGERAIAVGTGEDRQLMLRGVAQTANIKSGDRYISSGLAGRYPSGYPVGQVDQVTRKKTARFLEVRLHLAAKTQRSNQLLLVDQITSARKGKQHA